MILVATTEADLFQENLDSSFPCPSEIKAYPLAYAHCILLTQK